MRNNKRKPRKISKIKRGGVVTGKVIPFVPFGNPEDPVEGTGLTAFQQEQTTQESQPLTSLGEIVDESDLEYNCSEGQMLRCFADGLTSCIDESSSNWPENECGEKVNEINECSTDTTLATYKIIRTKNILMIGNGVEFGERNTVWLAAPNPNSGESNQIGIVMDKLEHRWTEDYWSEDDALDWKEFSRLEL